MAESSEQDTGTQPDEQIDPLTLGGLPQEDVEDRPNVSTVTPEEYPDKASGDDVLP